MPQHVSAFNEIEKQFVTEFDYRGEATNLDRVRSAVSECAQSGLALTCDA
jgi:aarF domain-containing kinase